MHDKNATQSSTHASWISFCPFYYHFTAANWSSIFITQSVLKIQRQCNMFKNSVVANTCRIPFTLLNFKDILFNNFQATSWYSAKHSEIQSLSSKIISLSLLCQFTPYALQSMYQHTEYPPDTKYALNAWHGQINTSKEGPYELNHKIHSKYTNMIFCNLNLL